MNIFHSILDLFVSPWRTGMRANDLDYFVYRVHKRTGEVQLQCHDPAGEPWTPIEECFDGENGLEIMRSWARSKEV